MSTSTPPSAIEQWIASLPEEQRALARESVQAELNHRAQTMAAAASSSSPSSSPMQQPLFNNAYDAAAQHATSNASPHSSPGASSLHASNANQQAPLPMSYPMSMGSIRTPPPEHFRGDRAKVEEFIDQLQRYIALSSISMMAPAVQVQQAAILLKDEALVWFRNAHTTANPITSIDDFVTRIWQRVLPSIRIRQTRAYTTTITEATDVGTSLQYSIHAHDATHHRYGTR